MSLPQFFQSPRQLMLTFTLVLVSISVTFGGASRLDLVAPLVPRLVAIVVLGWVAWTLTKPVARIDRRLWWFWGALLALPIIQLIPLPWSIWINLPGRGFAADIYTALGERPWQPISLTPDRTLNGLFALVPALAAFVAATRIDDSGRDRVLLLIAVFAVSSAMIGLLQVGGGPGSAFYLYAITNSDSAVGWFSNANHNSLMLCSGIVLIFYWIAGELRGPKRLPWGKIFMAAMGLACLFTALPATASRAGVILSVPALLGGVAMLPREKLGISAARLWGGTAALLAIGAAVVLALAYRRVFGDGGAEDVLADGRIRNVGDFLEIGWRYFPFGSGLGSFDPVYRMFEDVTTIQLNYLNNAHNDPAQIFIEAGLPGVVLMVAFVGWLVRAGLRAWRRPGYDARQTRQLRAATLILVLLSLHSLADYPLRTAALSVVFAFCAGMLAARPVNATGRARGLALTQFLDHAPESAFSFSSSGAGHMTPS